MSNRPRNRSTLRRTGPRRPWMLWSAIGLGALVLAAVVGTRLLEDIGGSPHRVPSKQAASFTPEPMDAPTNQRGLVADGMAAELSSQSTLESKLGHIRIHAGDFAPAEEDETADKDDRGADGTASAESESPGNIGLVSASASVSASTEESEMASERQDGESGFLTACANWLDSPVQPDAQRYAQHFIAFAVSRDDAAPQAFPKALEMLIQRFKEEGYRSEAAIEPGEKLLNLASSDVTDSRMRSAIFLEFAHVHSSAGDLEGAIDLARQAADWNPVSIEAIRFLAGVHSARSEWDEALPWMRRLARLQPERPEFTANLATVLTKTGSHKEALQLLLDNAEAIRKSESLAIRFLEAVEAAATVGAPLPDGAEMMAVSLKEDFPESRGVRFLTVQVLDALGRSSQALALLEDSLDSEAFHGELLEKLTLYRVQLIERSGDAKAAEREYLALLENDNPFRLQIKNNLAYMWINQGRNLDEADTLLQTILEEEPDNPAFQDTFGLLHLSKGKPETALHYFQSALDALGRDHPQVLIHIGRAHAMLGNEEEAQDAYRRAIQSGASPEEIDKHLSSTH